MSFLCEDCKEVLGDKNDSMLRKSILLETVNVDYSGKTIPYTRIKYTEDSDINKANFTTKSSKDVSTENVNDFLTKKKYIREVIYFFNCKKCNKPRCFIDKVSGILHFGIYNDKKLISSKSDGAIFYSDLLKRTKNKSEKERINKLVDDFQSKKEKIESKKNAQKLRAIDKIRKDQKKPMSFKIKLSFFILLVSLFLIIFNNI